MPITFYHSWSPARWVGISFSVFAIVVAGGACLTFFDLPKIYEAHAQVQLAQDGGGTSLSASVKRMKSSEFLLPIISDLNLDKAWARDLDFSGSLEPQYSFLYMRKVIRFEIKPAIRIIDIQASSSRPQEAAEIANAIADRFESITEFEYDRHMEKLPHPTDAQLGERPVVIILRATSPTRPSKPNNVLNLMIAVWAGIVLGGLIGVLVEWAVWHVANAAEAVKGVERKAPASAEY